MTLDHKTEFELEPELESIATLAAERLRATTEDDSQRDVELQREIGEAVGRAIAAGVSLSAIADAERIGQTRVREELGRDVLRGVERAARRRRDAEHECDQAVRRAARLGLAHRDIAAAGQMARGTIRAVLTRTQVAVGVRELSTVGDAVMTAGAEPQPVAPPGASGVGA